MRDILVRMRRCFQPRQWFAGEGEPDPFVVDDEEAFMWVYRKGVAETTNYEVGYFTPDGTWFGDGEYPTREAAAARVRYLNGGLAPPDRAA